MTEFSLDLVKAARAAISDIAVETPLVPSPYLSGVAGQDFFLKLEVTQPVGAFKLRGAAHSILNLSEDVAGVTCCSTGNHGRGVAYAAARRGMRAVICMSSLVPQAKVDGIKALGAEVRITGTSQDDALAESQRLVREEGLVEISPFDDPYVVSGQATIALELLDQRPDLDTILVPLSGGGLAGGVAYTVKQLRPEIRVIGVSMDRGAAMQASIAAGHPVEVEEVASLADSLGGGVGLENRLSFPLCRDNLDQIVQVSESDVYHALQAVYYEDRLVCEGASVVGAAALLAGKLGALKGPVATVVTGRNLDMHVHADIMQGRDVRLGEDLLPGRVYRRNS